MASAKDTKPTPPTPQDDDPGARMPDPVAFAQAMTGIAERSQTLVREFLDRQKDQAPPKTLDPLNLGGAFFEMTTKLMADPAKLMTAQMELWQDYMRLWQHSAAKFLGVEDQSPPLAEPEPGDKRFKDKSWDENALFDYIKQSYLLTAQWIQGTVQSVEGMEDKSKKKVDFYTRQFVDAMAPSNFVMTNPQVIKETVESGGDNLLRGLDNLLTDLERGKGRLAIRMTDTDAFTVGENVAVSPGKVVYQNDLMQLIQYAPATETVHKLPLVIIPPLINKYYILDLKPKNSFVKWAVEQGLTVFMISWVNPTPDLAEKTFEDYMFEGPLAALRVAREITGQDQANVIGYCLGGTLLASTLAYLTAKGEADQVKSATYFTALVDFTEPGELGVFIDEEQLAALDARMREAGGILNPGDMATTFNMLRANDLIWSFVVNNYLMGKDPFPFDLLYWNSDSTAMPRAMHSFYLRNMYQENKLVEPGGITLDGVAIDLTTIKTPTFILSTREDHIAPWKSTYAATQLYGGPVKFCLSASGHIAGVVNPPAAQKYCHWTHSRKPKSPEAWLNAAKQVDGSWWPEWYGWVSRHAGAKQTPALVPGDGPHKALEDAPGSYVRVRPGDGDGAGDGDARDA